MSSFGRITAYLALLIMTGHAWTQPVTNPRTITISPDGSGADFSTLSAALNSIVDASASNRYVILAYPGTYNIGPILDWKSHVSLKGVQRDSVIFRGAGSCQDNYFCALIDAIGTVGAEFSNVTLDGTPLGQIAGVTNVCGAEVRFHNVLFINDNGSESGYALTSEGLPNTFLRPCTTSGSVVVTNSEFRGGIVDLGGEWLISNCHMRVQTTGDALTIQRTTTNGMPGRMTIVSSTLEAVGRPGGEFGVITPYYIYDGVSEVNIIASKLTARVAADAPVGSPLIAAAIYSVFPTGLVGGSMLIEGTEMRYESINSAQGGRYYGIYAPNYQATPVLSMKVVGSRFRSAGSGGTRADVYREDGGPELFVTATEYDIVQPSAEYEIKAADQRQGLFSADMTIPITPPTADVPAPGQVWVDPATNQFCYRSSGQTRCVSGTPTGGGAFLKVARVGLTSAPGDLVCKKQGPSRRGEAQVVILNRDTSAPIAGAVVTGDWTGAAPATGVTATTDSAGVGLLTSGTAPAGSTFTFTVTNVTLAGSTYDPASNAETFDSTPACN
jgi:hypothetical protein